MPVVAAAMADPKGLQWIGLGLGTVTAAVMLIAALVVAEAARGTIERAPVMARASAANG